MDPIEHVDPSPRHWWAVAWRIGAVVAACAVALGLATLVTAGVSALPQWTPPAVVVATLFVGLVFLIRWHARTHAYRCSHCGAEFTISATLDAFTLNLINRNGAVRWLRCPTCHRRGLAKVLAVATRDSQRGAPQGTR